MLKNLFTSNFRKLPSAFLLSMMLLFCMELIVRHYAYRIIPASEYIADYKKHVLETREKLRYDGIILADSYSLGINAKLISDIIKKETKENFELYNFSFPNFGIQGYYVFLRKYIKTHKKPKVVFFETMPLLLTGKYDLIKKDSPGELHRFCCLFYVKDYCDVVPFGFKLKTLVSKLEMVSALITYRGEIRGFLLNIFYKDMGPMLTGQIGIDNNGRAMFWKDRKITSEEIADSYEYKESFYVDENALFWYKKVLSLAKENDIKIIIFNTPTIYEIFEKWESGGMNEKYKAVMFRLKNSYNNVSLIEPLCEGYDKKYFFNVPHLNDAGHDLFSAELAKRIIKHLR